MHGEQGSAGLVGGHGAPDFSSSRCVGFRVFYKARDSHELMKKEEENCLPSPIARPGEGERRTMSLKTTMICSFFVFFLWGPKNRLQHMPPLYNTYRAGVLHSKFYKDKQN